MLYALELIISLCEIALMTAIIVLVVVAIVYLLRETH
jgi:hypothetical protein